MMDTIINVVWVVGAVILWYPLRQWMIYSFDDEPFDAFARTISIAISGILIWVWPLAVFVLPGIALFWLSRWVWTLGSAVVQRGRTMRRGDN